MKETEFVERKENWKLCKHITIKNKIIKYKYRRIRNCVNKISFFFLFTNLIIYYIPVAAPLFLFPSLPPSLPTSLFPQIPISTSPYKRVGFPGTTVKNGIKSYNKTKYRFYSKVGWSNPVVAKGSGRKKKKSQRPPLILLLRELNGHQATQP